MSDSNKKLFASSVIYRIYQVVLDATVIFILINVFSLINSLLIALTINLVKVVTYYIYHKNFDTLIIKLKKVFG